ncbi:hypothetical protein [Photobacterium leiognathi]|uniref:hypothetical protein n=1 Tax=Photobacterium leiognathi TaxID=553611 RepID=UPI002980DACC|nr:hypothetical protein [Photobacterium leiognathi]
MEIASGSNGGEIPDAFGLKTADGTETIVIEAKTSRSDFFADQKKIFRQNSKLGMGNFRYYICPEDLIQPHELPPKWGLIYVGKRGKVSVICGHILSNKKSDFYHESNRHAELGATSILLNKLNNADNTNQLLNKIKQLEKQIDQLNKKAQLDNHHHTETYIKALDNILPNTSN